MGGSGCQRCKRGGAKNISDCGRLYEERPIDWIGTNLSTFGRCDRREIALTSRALEELKADSNRRLVSLEGGHKTKSEEKGEKKQKRSLSGG